MNKNIQIFVLIAINIRSSFVLLKDISANISREVGVELFEYRSMELIDVDENICLLSHLAMDVEDVHTHDFIEIEYIWKGSGYQIVNGESYYVERGDIILLNVGDKHTYKPNGEMGVIDCLINPRFFSSGLSTDDAVDVLTLSLFKEFRKDVDKLTPKISLSKQDMLDVEIILYNMFHEFAEKSQGYVTALKGYCYVLMTKILRGMVPEGSSGMYTEIAGIIPKILEYIEENYNERLTLKQLAEESFYNPNYLSTLFKEYVGKTFSEYVTEKRMESAIELLRSTDQSIEQICYQVGYSSRKQFYRHFRAYTGVTPKQYRDKTLKSIRRDL